MSGHTVSPSFSFPLMLMIKIFFLWESMNYFIKKKKVLNPSSSNSYELHHLELPT